MKRGLSPFWTLFILTGLNLFNYLDRAVLSAVLPDVRDSLHLNYDQAGTLATAFMLGYFLTSPIFGYLGDRLPRKWLIALGIFVWSIGTLLSGTAHTFWNLICFRVLVGLGEASYATISPSILSDKFFGEKRNMAMTIFSVAVPVGYALGFLIGGEVAERWSWRHAFIWAGAPGLVLALVLLPFPEAPRVEGADKPKPSVRDMLRLFTSGNYMLVVLGYVAYTFALGGFQHWAPTFFATVHGMTQKHADKLFGTVMVVAGLVGGYAGGYAASAWHKRNPAAYAWILGWSLVAATPFAAAALMARDGSVAMGLLGFAMVLLFLSMGPVNTLIIETVPAQLRASAMALSIFMIHLFGDLWSPKIVGYVADRTSLSRAVLILPLALVPAAILWLALALRQSLGQQRPIQIPNSKSQIPS